MDEGRKRVIGIMASILTSLHMERADDLFGGPQGSPRNLVDKGAEIRKSCAVRGIREVETTEAEAKPNGRI